MRICHHVRDWSLERALYGYFFLFDSYLKAPLLGISGGLPHGLEVAARLGYLLVRMHGDRKNPLLSFHLGKNTCTISEHVNIYTTDWTSLCLLSHDLSATSVEQLIYDVLGKISRMISDVHYYYVHQLNF
jgi:hypothetical protein